MEFIFGGRTNWEASAFSVTLRTILLRAKRRWRILGWVASRAAIKSNLESKGITAKRRNRFIETTSPFCSIEALYQRGRELYRSHCYWHFPSPSLRIYFSHLPRSRPCFNPPNRKKGPGGRTEDSECLFWERGESRKKIADLIWFFFSIFLLMNPLMNPTMNLFDF